MSYDDDVSNEQDVSPRVNALDLLYDDEDDYEDYDDEDEQEQQVVTTKTVKTKNIS